MEKYTLSDTGKSRWRERLQERRRVQHLTQEEVLKKMDNYGLSGELSRFENGHPTELQRWLDGEHAARYAEVLGLTLEELRSWLDEARGFTSVGGWHPAFPTVDALFVPVAVRRGGFPTTLDAMVERLRSEPSATVWISGAEGTGRRTLKAEILRRLPDLHLNVEVLIDAEATSSARQKGDRRNWIETQRWGRAELDTLTDALTRQGQLTATEAERGHRVARRCAEEGLELSADLAIQVLRDVSREREDRPVREAMVRSFWLRAVARDSSGVLARLEPTWIEDVWAYLRLGICGEGWAGPSRATVEDAIAQVRGERQRPTPDPEVLDELLRRACEGSAAERRKAAVHLREAFGWPEAPVLLDALVDSGLLIDEGDRLHAPWADLAALLAARGLSRRMPQVLADPVQAWRLDPSWIPILRELGALGTPLGPVLERVDSPPALAIDGARALMHVLTTHPSPVSVPTDRLWALHATALLSALAGTWEENPSVTYQPAVRPLLATLRDLSRRLVAQLGWIEGEPLLAMWERAPADLRTHLDPRGRLLATADGRGLDLPPMQGVPRWGLRALEAQLADLLAWQMPPVDEQSWQNASALRGDELSEKVLIQAAKLGHGKARATLAGALEDPDAWLHEHPDAEEDDLGILGAHSRRIARREAMRADWPTLFPDRWRCLSFETRTTWLGHDGTEEQTRRAARWLLNELMAALNPSPYGGQAGVGAEPETLRAQLLTAFQRLPAAVLDPIWDEELTAIGRGQILNDTRCTLLADLAWRRRDLRVLRALDRVLRQRLVDATVRPKGVTGPWDIVLHPISFEPRPPPERPGARPVKAFRSQLIREGLWDALLVWERLREQIATWLADLGDPAPLRSRAANGTGWTWPSHTEDQLDRQLLLADLHTAEPDVLSVWTSPIPVARIEAVLDELATGSRLTDGRWRPSAARPLPPTEEKYLWMASPWWLRQFHAEIEAIRQRAGDEALRPLELATGLLRVIFAASGFGEPPAIDGLDDVLMDWLYGLARFSTTGPSTRAWLDARLRPSAASILLDRHDQETIRGWALHDRGRHRRWMSHPESWTEAAVMRQEITASLEDDGAAELDLLLKERLRDNPPLREAVWRHADSAEVRAMAFDAAIEASLRGVPLPRWAAREQEKRVALIPEAWSPSGPENQRALIAWIEAVPDSDQRAWRAAKGLHLRPTWTNALDSLLAWCDSDGPLRAPGESSNRALHDEDGVLGAEEGLECLGRHATDARVIDALASLWGRVTALPVANVDSGSDTAGLNVLPSSAAPPARLGRLLSLLAEAGQHDLLLAVFEDDDPTPLPSVPAAWAWDDLWAEPDDSACPPGRGDLLRLWVSRAVVPPEPLLVRWSKRPGLTRRLARHLLWDQGDRALLLPVLRAVLAQTPPENRLSTLWSERWWRLVQLSPDEAWIWIQARWLDHPECRPALRAAVLSCADLLMGARPEVLRWTRETVL